MEVGAEVGVGVGVVGEVEGGVVVVEVSVEGDVGVGVDVGGVGDVLAGEVVGFETDEAEDGKEEVDAEVEGGRGEAERTIESSD